MRTNRAGGNAEGRRPGRAERRRGISGTGPLKTLLRMLLATCALGFVMATMFYNLQRIPHNVFDELLNADLDRKSTALVLDSSLEGNYEMDGFDCYDIWMTWLNPLKSSQFYSFDGFYSVYGGKEGPAARRASETTEKLFDSDGWHEAWTYPHYTVRLSASSVDDLAVIVTRYACEGWRSKPGSTALCAMSYNRVSRRLEVVRTNDAGDAERYFYGVFLAAYFADVGGESAFSPDDLGDYEEVRLDGARGMEEDGR